MDHFNQPKEKKGMYRLFKPGDPPEKIMVEEKEAKQLMSSGEAFLARSDAIAAAKGWTSVTDEVLAEPIPEEDEDPMSYEKEEYGEDYLDEDEKIQDLDEEDDEIE